MPRSNYDKNDPWAMLPVWQAFMCTPSWATCVQDIEDEWLAYIGGGAL